MYISKIRLKNFKNFHNNEVEFNDKTNTIIGENGTGKTNLFQALRFVLDKNNRMFFSEEFFSNKVINPRGHWIIISVHFNAIGGSVQEAYLKADENNQSVLTLIYRPKKEVRKRLYELSEELKSQHNSDEKKNIRNKITEYINGINIITDYQTNKRVSNVFDFLNEKEYKKIVGDFENYTFPDPDGVQDDTKIIGNYDENFANFINFTFIPAIRDVNQELTRENNFVNRMLKSISTGISDDEWLPFEDIIENFNNEMSNINEFNQFVDDVDKITSETVGSEYKTDLKLVMDLPNKRNNIIKYFSLKGKEEEKEYSLYNRSLGDNNIVYLALKLVESQMNLGQSEKIFNVMIIEEPEAHVHKFLQQSLFKGLQERTNFQLFLSTHSVYISEATNISSLVVLDKKQGVTNTYYVSNKLEDDEIRYIQRYLDATKSSLLFSKSVLLVEGTVELLMIPKLFELKYNIKFENYGIDTISIDGSHFVNLAKLFHKDRIKKYASIIADGDKEVDGEKTRKSESAAKRNNSLIEYNLENKYVNVSLSRYTFEIDFYMENIEILKTYAKEMEIYKDNSLLEELSSENFEVKANRIMKIVNNVGKGWMAFDFINWLEKNRDLMSELIIPKYIIDAVNFLFKNSLKESDYEEIYKIYGENEGDLSESTHTDIK